MKRRIKRLELLEEEKDLKLLVVEKVNNNLYIEHNVLIGEEAKEYTRADIDKLEEEGTLVLVIVWGKEDS